MKDSELKADGFNINENRDQAAADPVGVIPNYKNIFTSTVFERQELVSIRKKAYHRAVKRGDPRALVKQAIKSICESFNKYMFLGMDE